MIKIDVMKAGLALVLALNVFQSLVLTVCSWVLTKISGCSSANSTSNTILPFIKLLKTETAPIHNYSASNNLTGHEYFKC